MFEKNLENILTIFVEICKKIFAQFFTKNIFTIFNKNIQTDKDKNIQTDNPVEQRCHHNITDRQGGLQSSAEMGRTKNHQLNKAEIETETIDILSPLVLK